MAAQPPRATRPIANATPDAPIIFAFYLVPDFTLLTVSSAIEALRLANCVLGQEVFTWRLVSECGGTVRANCGLSVPTNSHLELERKTLSGRDRPSMVVVCADQNVEEYSNKSLQVWLRECRQRAIHVGALGAGAYILAMAGLLENKHCTIHWEKLPGFAEKFIRTVTSTNIYELDDGIWTCAGGSASFDMMLHLIERDFGERVAAGVCERALVERGRGPGERQRLPLSVRYGIWNETVVKAVEEMALHLTEPLSIDDLADHVGLSRRQLERLFQRELECSPVRYYRRLRMERATLLLSQSTMPIVDIAAACGFISASHFSKCFREANGKSPQEVRKSRLRPMARPVAARQPVESASLLNQAVA